MEWCFIHVIAFNDPLNLPQIHNKVLCRFKEISGVTAYARLKGKGLLGRARPISESDAKEGDSRLEAGVGASASRGDHSPSSRLESEVRLTCSICRKHLKNRIYVGQHPSWNISCRRLWCTYSKQNHRS